MEAQLRLPALDPLKNAVKEGKLGLGRYRETAKSLIDTLNAGECISNITRDAMISQHVDWFENQIMHNKDLAHQKPAEGNKRWAGFTLIELLIVVAIIGIIAAIAIPNLLSAIDRGKQKRTMADMRSVGTAIESYSIDNNVYPVATNMGALETSIEPIYIRQAPLNDGWGRTFQVSSTIGDYTICSNGKNGSGTCITDNGGPTNNFNESITFVSGGFVQWPQGAQQ